MSLTLRFIISIGLIPVSIDSLSLIVSLRDAAAISIFSFSSVGIFGLFSWATYLGIVHVKPLCCT